MLAVAEHRTTARATGPRRKPAAWDALFRRYQLPLYVYVFELVRDEQASLDLVQETFIAAVRHIGSLRDDGKFGSWLFGIAHQKVIQRWRKHGGKEILFDEIPESAGRI
jgi:RNA polymerase sigma-70 factor (ECF subfamily)